MHAIQKLKQVESNENLISAASYMPTSRLTRADSFAGPDEPLEAIRRTRIICTIGPASSSDEKLDQILRAGMDISRLNYSHGDLESKTELINKLRAAEKRVGKPLALLADLPGPKIRLGILSQPLTLPVGAVVEIHAGVKSMQPAEVQPPGDSVIHLPAPYEGLSEDIKTGDAVLIADGLVKLKVTNCPGKACAVIRCVVEVGGPIDSRKGLNLPNTLVKLPAVTDADMKAMCHALDHGVDFVAVSYVRNGQDLAPAREELRRRKSIVPLVAKIEHPSALRNMAEILREADAVMVARGDLGVEIPMETLPLAQEEIIRAALGRGLPVIVATQVLESMQFNPTPTRAELTDIATAIRQGTSCLMLSGETATGQYPIEAVTTMAEVAREVDLHPLLGSNLRPMRPKPWPAQALAHA
eukprot:RCo000133